MKAKECCFPSNPPIRMTIPPYIVKRPVPNEDIKIRTNAPKEIADRLTAELLPRLLPQSVTLTYANETGPGILTRDQVNPQIAAILGYRPDGYYIDKPREQSSLLSPLHAVKYHQQQCMYRIDFLRQKSKTSRKRPGGVNQYLVVQYEDVPLRSEFESFMARSASALDALSKYACRMTGTSKRHGTHFSLFNHLKECPEKQPVLAEMYSKYEEWARTVIRDARDDVVHDGMLWSMEPSKNMTDDERFIVPSWNGTPVDQLCVDHWRTLIEFVAGVRSAVSNVTGGVHE